MAGKRSLILATSGCVLLVAAFGAFIFAAFWYLRPHKLSSPLVLALENCQGGKYVPPAKPDIFDDLAQEPCEQSKGLDGAVSLDDNALTVSVHNASVYPLTYMLVRLRLRGRSSITTREYRLEGHVPPLGDGALSVRTNLQPGDYVSMSAELGGLAFEVPRQ